MPEEGRETPDRLSKEETERRLREIADLFARVASVKSLATLRTGERMILEEDLHRILFGWLGNLGAVVEMRHASDEELLKWKPSRSSVTFLIVLCVQCCSSCPSLD